MERKVFLSVQLEMFRGKLRKVAYPSPLNYAIKVYEEELKLLR